MNNLSQTSRTTLKRLPQRGSYDRELANEILDEGLICHAGFVQDDQVFVIPTAYARDGDSILLHGSIASRMMRQMSMGLDVCVTVTLLDGLVLARSVFEHSMNYRSVVIVGEAKLITDQQRKLEALKLLTERLVPGRWADARQPTRQEVAATAVVELPVLQASIKTRSGPPEDLAKDQGLPVWAGEIPLSLTTETPRPDQLVPTGMTIPDYLSAYSRKPAGAMKEAV